MTDQEFAEIQRTFFNKFNAFICKYNRPPETCFISQPTWNEVQSYFVSHMDEVRRPEPSGRPLPRNTPLHLWNGLPVVRVMDENYFELR